MEKKKAADQTPNNDKKQALDTAIRQIEKNFGKGAVMRLGDRPDLQVDAIPTGSLALDAALGIGGVPKGRIIEIYGPESSGKTTLALHIVAQAQKRGGEVAFVDAEHALDPDYAARIGVDIDSCWFPSRIPANRRWRSQTRLCAPARSMLWSSTLLRR